jgi:hypothetical protein
VQYASNSLSLRAVVTIKKCGRVVTGAIPRVQWTASIVGSRAPAKTHTGSGWSIPANTFSAEQKVAVTVQAAYGTSKENVKTAKGASTIAIAAVPVTGSLRGGADREVAANSEFSVGGFVTGPSSLKTGSISIGVDSRALKCSVIATAIARPASADSGTNVVASRKCSGPAGTYTFNLYYGSIVLGEQKVKIAAADKKVLDVQLLAPKGTQTLEQAVAMYALVSKPKPVVAAANADAKATKKPVTIAKPIDASSPILMSWSVSGAGLPDQKDKMLKMTPEFIKAALEKITADSNGIKTLTISVTAKQGDATGTATTTIRVVASLGTPECTITAADPTQLVTGAESSLKLKTSGWSTAIAITGYKFGYVKERAIRAKRANSNATTTTQREVVPITGSSGSDVTFTAPIPSKTEKEVEFVVTAIANGKPVGKTTCKVEIARPVDMTAVRTTQLTELDSAAEANDATAVLAAAQLAASAGLDDDCDGTTCTAAEVKKVAEVKVAAKAAKKKIVAALAKTFSCKPKPTTAPTKGTTAPTTKAATTAPSTGVDNDCDGITKEEARSTMQVLAKMIRQTKNTTNTDEEQTQVRELVTSILDASASKIDTIGQADEIMEVIADLKEKKAIRSCTRKLSLAAATNLPMGESQNITSQKYNVSATKRPASDCKNVTVQSGNVKVTLSSAMIDSIPAVQDSTEVAISTVRYTEDPTDSSEDLLSAATEVDVQADGVSTTVKDLKEPITIVLQVTTGTKKSTEASDYNSSRSNKAGTKAQDHNGSRSNTQASAVCQKPAAKAQDHNSSRSNKRAQKLQEDAKLPTCKPVCRYFNKETEKWTSEGVKTGKYDPEAGTVECHSTHLSMFAVSHGSQTTNVAASNDGDSSHLMYVYIGCGAAAVILVAVVAVVVVNSKSKRHANHEFTSNGDLLDMNTLVAPTQCSAAEVPHQTQEMLPTNSRTAALEDL